MTGKLSGIASINTNPLTNPFCVEMHKSDENIICSYCYSISMLEGFRKNCVPAFQRNSDALIEEISDDDIPKIKENMARFHSHGELLNQQHLLNFIMIAASYEEKRFVLFTKRRGMIRSLTAPVPDNLVMIFSNPRLNAEMDTVPEGFHKTFNVVNEDGYEINCGGKSCLDCQQCWSRVGNRTIIERLK